MSSSLLSIDWDDWGAERRGCVNCSEIIDDGDDVDDEFREELID